MTALADSRDPADPPARLVCVVSHTHWDREWYHGGERFAQRLTALIDALLGLPTGVLANTPFLLDGQAITLRDYLDRRPSQRQPLQAALQTGQIEAGPWFVLGDNLIPSGEAIVRNLEAGRRVLAELGITAPPVAYCPDTFGHPAAMPFMARGFGLEVAVVWRGAGGAGGPHEDAFRWMAPNGASVLTCHLPPDGYEYGSALPTERGAADERWIRMRALFDARNRSGVVLLLNGADHHARQPDLEAALNTLQDAARAEARIEATSLSQWAERLGVAVRDRPLPTVHGELRDSYGYTWTLGGTLATRAHQKRHNARLERGLLRDVEPWLALARLHDAPVRCRDARLGMEQLPDLLHHAWETLLSTHPHDTLCGCSIDAVARGMDQRQEQVADAGRGLREAALQLVTGYDAVTARHNAMDFDWRRLVLRNRVARPRGGVSVVDLVDVLGDVPVGPGSGAAPMPVMPRDAASLNAAGWLMQSLRTRVGFHRRESAQHYPDNDLVRRQRTLVWVPPMPALGVSALNLADHAVIIPHALPETVRVESTADECTIDNGTLRLSLRRREGEWRLALRQGVRTLEGVLSVESQQDIGDTYTPAPRGVPETLRAHRCAVIARGPLRGSVRLWWRSADRRVRLHTTLSLDADAHVLRCDVRGQNRRHDHRLQLVWHTDVQAGDVYADAAFGPVHRGTVPRAAGDQRTSGHTLVETVPQGEPMHRWVAHATRERSVVMLSDGLAEYEVQPGRMALTLLRAVGELSRADLPERPGHAGWPSPVPEAQSQGVFEAQAGVLLTEGWSQSTLRAVHDAVDDLLLPLVGESWFDFTTPEATDSSQSCHRGGAALEGDALEASACTISSVDERAIVLRAINLADQDSVGAWVLPDDGPWLVTHCRLDETPLLPNAEANTSASRVSDGVVHGRRIELVLAPRDVLTIRLRREPGGPR